ncbi:MAG: peptide deformylase [Candidatus Omnitrophica bacterium]|nr:peptide deformylase [Candidatus Omnitrophota bacterium]
MILKVARLGNPVLRKKARGVNLKQLASPGIQVFIQDLIQTMHEYDGVGIAAPQVHVSLQVAVIGADHNPRYPKAPRIPLTVLINPRVWPEGRGAASSSRSRRPASGRQVMDWEGCLSVEGVRGRVPRWHSVRVEAYNAEGKPVCFRATGFFARVIQHEWDHLQGKVFLDRMKDLTTLTHLTEYARYWAKG